MQNKYSELSDFDLTKLVFEHVKENEFDTLSEGNSYTDKYEIVTKVLGLTSATNITFNPINTPDDWWPLCEEVLISILYVSKNVVSVYFDDFEAEKIEIVADKDFIGRAVCEVYLMVKERETR